MHSGYIRSGATLIFIDSESQLCSRQIIFVNYCETLSRLNKRLYFGLHLTMLVKYCQMASVPLWQMKTRY
jgi:hypothetical protein